MTEPRCGKRHGNFVCDRDLCHDGWHRSYYETVDENVFWSDPPMSDSPNESALRDEIARLQLENELLKRSLTMLSGQMS